MQSRRDSKGSKINLSLSPPHSAYSWLIPHRKSCTLLVPTPFDQARTEFMLLFSKSFEESIPAMVDYNEPRWECRRSSRCHLDDPEEIKDQRSEGKDQRSNLFNLIVHIGRAVASCSTEIGANSSQTRHPFTVRLKGRDQRSTIKDHRLFEPWMRML